MERARERRRRRVEGWVEGIEVFSFFFWVVFVAVVVLWGLNACGDGFGLGIVKKPRLMFWMVLIFWLGSCCSSDGGGISEDVMNLNCLCVGSRYLHSRVFCLLTLLWYSVSLTISLWWKVFVIVFFSTYKKILDPLLQGGVFFLLPALKFN